MPQSDSGSLVNVSDEIDNGPWSMRQKLVLVLTAVAFAIDGLANQVLGVSMPAIIEDWGVARDALAPVAAFGLFGIAIGAVVGGVLADRVGRRWMLIGAVTVFGLMTVLASMVQDLTSLAAVRFVDGLGIGAAIPSAAAIIAETTPSRRRAIGIAIGMVFIPVGGLLSGLFGAMLLPTVGWRGLFLTTGIIALAIAVLFTLVLPESLSFLVGRPNRQGELAKLLRSFGRALPSDVSFTDRPVTAGGRHWTALLHKSVRGQTLGIWFGFFCCLLATYTLFSWLPTLLNGNGFSLSQSSFTMSAIHGGASFGGVLAGFALQRWGARLPTMAMAAAAALLTIGLAVMPITPDQYTFILAVLCFQGLLLAGLHTGFYTLAAVSYPSALRATGIGSTSAFGRLGAIMSSYTGVITMGLDGTWAYFALIAVALGLGAWCASFARPGGIEQPQAAAEPEPDAEASPA